MHQNTAMCKAIDSIQQQVEIELTEHQIDIICDHLYLTFGAGFDEGRKQNSHAKPVVQSKNGKVIKTYNSVTEAAHALSVDKTSISKCVRGKTSNCKGYKFTFAESMENI